MFEDAKENGERSSEEYDMEVVLESPIVGMQSSMKRSLYCFISLLNQCFIGKDVQVICAYFICIFSSSTINN
jgi:hypothetical protein